MKKAKPAYGVITETIVVQARFYFGGDKKDWDEKGRLVAFGSMRSIGVKKGAFAESKGIKVTFE